ncbi:MAG: hypothetical protein ACLR1V_10965 [Coprococcus sp.]
MEPFKIAKSIYLPLWGITVTPDHRNFICSSRQLSTLGVTWQNHWVLIMQRRIYGNSETYSGDWTPDGTVYYNEDMGTP